MGYEATTGVIIYCNTYQRFSIHISHHAWFDEYNSRLSIKDNHTPVYLLLQQYPESLLHNLDLLNFIPFEPDLTSTLFCDTTIITYEIELPPSGKKIGFNILEDEDFTILYITDKIPNSSAGHKILTQAKKYVDH